MRQRRTPIAMLCAVVAGCGPSLDGAPHFTRGQCTELAAAQGSTDAGKAALQCDCLQAKLPPRDFDFVMVSEIEAVELGGDTDVAERLRTHARAVAVESGLINERGSSAYRREVDRVETVVMRECGQHFR